MPCGCGQCPLLKSPTSSSNCMDGDCDTCKGLLSSPSQVHQYRLRHHKIAGKGLSTVLKKIRDYRWELWLFIGVAIATVPVTVVFAAIFSPIADLVYSLWLDLPHNVALLSVLAVSYWRVRRLRRPLFRLLWQHSIAAVTFSLAFSLVTAGLIYDEDLSTFQIGIRGSLAVLASTPIHVAILVWFARKASRGGFNYALAFIGITAFPDLVGVIEVGGWSPGYYFGGLIFRMTLILVVVRALHRADMGEVVNGRAIATLFLAALLGQASSVLLPPADWLPVILVNALFVVVPNGVGVGLAYLMRVREIDPDFVTVEKPPTDERKKAACK